MKKTMKSILAITLALVIMLSIAVTGLSVSAAKTLYAPTKVRIYNNGTGFNVSWEKAANAASYRVYYKTAESDWNTADTNTNSVNLTDLEYGKLYYIQVQTLGVNKAGGNFTKPSSMTHVRGTTLTSTVYNSNGTVTLGWNEADGANGYAVAKIKAGDKKYTYFYTADTTFTDTNIVGGTAYYYQVNPYYSNGKSAAYSHWSSTKALTSLYRPTVKDTNSSPATTPANMNINWNQINGAKTYQLAYKTATDANWTKVVTSSRYYNVPNPTQGATYYIQVQALNGKFTGSWSEVYSHEAETLGTPTITGIETDYDKASFNWDAVDDATGYEVQFKRTTDTDDAWNKRITAATTYTVPNPTQGATYMVKVRALCKDVKGESSETNESDIPVLGVPTITGIESNYEKMSASWNAVDDATGYEIVYKRTTDTDWNTRTTTALSYSVNEPTPGATYTVKVKALYNKASGKESEISNHNIPALGIPTITGIDAAYDRVTFNWSAASGAKQYEVQFKRTTDEAWNTRITEAPTYTVPKPTSGATYMVKVRAVRGETSGEFSTISEKVIPVLGTPTFTNVNATIYQLNINWSRVDGATGYQVAFMRKGDTAWNTRTTTEPTYTVPNPTKGATYYIQVQALCNDVKGSYNHYFAQVIPEKDPHEGLTYYEAGETVKVTHPAETELVWVVDEAAHDETKTEVKSVYHYRICQCPDCGAVMDGWTAEQIREHDLVFHGIGIYWNGQTFLSYPDHLPYSKPKSGYVNEPVDTILHVSEKGHYEVKVVKEAWEEDVTIAQSGWYKTITHPAETAQAKVIDKAAYYYEEPVYEYVYKHLCWGCDAIMNGLTSEEKGAHEMAHYLNGEISGYRKVKLQIKTGTNTINVSETAHNATVTTKESWNELVFVTDK